MCLLQFYPVGAFHSPRVANPTLRLSVVACWEGHIACCRGQKLQLVEDLEGHWLGKRVQKWTTGKFKLKSQEVGLVSLLNFFALGCICEKNKENNSSKSEVDTYRY